MVSKTIIRVFVICRNTWETIVNAHPSVEFTDLLKNENRVLVFYFFFAHLGFCIKSDLSILYNIVFVTLL